MRTASLPNSQSKFPSASCRQWAREEFSQARLGDQRLHKRLATMAADFLQNIHASIPHACAGKWSKTKAAYRFFDNDHVTKEGILASHAACAKERMRPHPLVLAVQDSTSLNYRHHPATKGLGLVGSSGERCIGLHLHTTMAFTPGGVALGILHAKTWIRPVETRGKARIREKLPLQAKESCKWMDSFSATAQLAQSLPGTQVVSIGDREADLYDLFLAAAAYPNMGVLVRARNKRPLHEQEGYCWDKVGSQPVAAVIEVRMPRKPGRKARAAQVELRYAELTLKPPKRKPRHPPIKVWMIEAREAGPEGKDSLHWKLTTTVPVTNAEQAIERLRWYQARWQVEEYHRVLKSGCGIENRQLETAGRIEKVLMLDMIVAWKVMELTRAARAEPDHPAAQLLEPGQIEIIKHLLKKKPKEPLLMREAVRAMAKLGGFLGRKADGEPGTMTIWRGLRKLEALLEGYLLAKTYG